MVVEMLQTGLGTTSVNALLVCLNIPSISPKSQKAREREVGRKNDDIAKSLVKKVCSQRNRIWNKYIFCAFLNEIIMHFITFINM